jgi:hypothetical protein
MGKDEMKGVPKYLPAFKAYMEQTPEKTPGILYEVFPPLDPARKPVLAFLEALAGPIPRTLEIWREPDGKIRICVYVENETVLEIWKSAYPGCKFQKMEKTEPEFVNTLKECPYFFSVEQGHALPFTFLDLKQAGTFIDHLIRLMNVPCWIQIVFQAYHWGDFAEEAATCWQQAVTELTEKKLAPKWEIKSGIDVRPSFEYAPASAKLTSTAIVQLGPTIAEQYFEKSHATAGIILHIRGLVAEPTTTLASAFSTVKINLDGLFAIEFRDARALRWMRARAIPDPAPFLTQHAKGGFLKEWGKGRELIPTLCLTPQELPIFVHLPTDPFLPVNYTREGSIPQLVTTPANFSDLVPHLLDRYHKYIVGMSGAGKTMLLIHLMMEWMKRPNPPAIIYLDPHGEGALTALKYAPLDRTLFFSPARTGASLNPLELGKYPPEERERIVFLWLQNFMKLFEELYASTPDTAPRMLHSLNTALASYYEVTDAPTLADIYDLMRELRAGSGQLILGELREKLVKKGKTALADDLESLSLLEGPAFDPPLHRLHLFRTNDFIYRTFCTTSTVHIEDMLKPGQLTLASMEGIGIEAAKIVITIFLLKLWYYLQYLFFKGEKPWVVLIIDEFQIVKELRIIEELLTQSRKYGLTLVLAHQNLEALTSEKLNTVIGNSGAQVSFRVTGDDASKLAANWDPRYREQIKQTIATIPMYNILARVQAKGGEEQSPPTRYLVPAPPPPVNSEKQIEKYIKMMRKYTMKEMMKVKPPTLKRTEKTAWQKYLPVSTIFPELEWKLLSAFFREGKMTFSRACAKAGVKRDEKSKAAWNYLIKEDYLTVTKEKIAAKEVEVADLTEKTRNYFRIIRNFGLIGGEEAQKIAEQTWNYHVQRGRFCSVIVQTATEKQHDLLAYDYANDKVTAIEVETTSEVKTHPEQIVQNVRKYDPKVFDELEFWTVEEAKAELKKIIDEQPRETQTRITLQEVINEFRI